MEAGRELDALIAQKVMGFTVEYTNKAWSMEDWLGSDTPTERNTYGIVNAEWKPGASYPHHSVIPYYSTDIGDVWLVVEKLKTRGYTMTMFIYGIGVQFRLESGGSVVALVEYNTAPLAICRAALKAIDDHNQY